MPECAYCGDWLSREYARVNGGNWGDVLCRDCGGPGPEFKPETARGERPGTIPRYSEDEMADDPRYDTHDRSYDGYNSYDSEKEDDAAEVAY